MQVKLMIDDARSIALALGYAPSDVEHATTPALQSLLAHYAANHPLPQSTRRPGTFYCRHCGTDEAMPGHEC